MIHKCAIIWACAALLLLTAQTTESSKICRAREAPPFPNLIEQEYWNYWTGYYCYTYSNDFRLNFRYQNFTTISITQDFFIIVNKINETHFFTFDYTNETTLDYVSLSFKTDHFFKMWKDCCHEAELCCDEMTDETITPTDEFPCPAIWDGWTCWGQTRKGKMAKKTCTSQAYSTDADICELLSEKQCFSNGTWNQKTNYGMCSIAPVLRNRHLFNVIVLAISAILSFPAVVVFFSLRPLRQNLRYILHRNLILVIVVRSLLTIMSKEIIILDALKSSKDSNGVMAGNSVACRVLAFFENVAKNGMYSCMLADGFYLHKMIVRPFANDPGIVFIYLVVFGLAFAPSLAWAIARGAHQATDCWMVDTSGDQWIIDGFRISILVINFVLLIDIIRVMIMKLKGTVSEHTKAAFKATMFLIPLFGVHIIIITNRNMVPDQKCSSQDIYYYVSYTIEGLQGVMVALLFCYINTEVHGELRNAYRKILLHLEQRFGFNVRKKDKAYRRRTTAATYVEPFGTSDL